jgi:hypothetical protein
MRLSGATLRDVGDSDTQLRAAIETNRQRAQQVRRNARATFLAMEGWQRVRNEEDWLKICADSQEQYVVTVRVCATERRCTVDNQERARGSPHRLTQQPRPLVERARQKRETMTETKWAEVTCAPGAPVRGGRRCPSPIRLCATASGPSWVRTRLTRFSRH